MMAIYGPLALILNVAFFILLAHLIMSWLINFQVLNLHQPFVAQVWHGLNRLLEPIYDPIRRILPDTRPLDLAPLSTRVARSSGGRWRRGNMMRRRRCSCTTSCGLRASCGRRRSRCRRRARHETADSVTTWTRT